MKDKVYAVGVDLGNGFTNYHSQKTGQGQRFETKIEPLTTNAFKKSAREDVHHFEIDGKRYVVGKGVLVENKDVERRINSNEYKIALLTAIAKSLPRPGFSRISLCVGLPIIRLEAFADKLESIIKGFDRVEFMCDNELYEIQIDSVTVFPEGALSVVQEINEEKVLTIDMGSGTVDCIEFEFGEPSSAIHTVPTSMNDIYAKVASRLNTKYGMSVKADDLEGKVGKPTMNHDREDIDISEHFEDIDAGVHAIYSDISARFHPLSQYNRIIMLGGASILTFDYWAKRIKGLELAEDAQYVNAKVFQAIAESSVA